MSRVCVNRSTFADESQKRAVHDRAGAGVSGSLQIFTTLFLWLGPGAKARYSRPFFAPSPVAGFSPPGLAPNRPLAAYANGDL